MAKLSVTGMDIFNELLDKLAEPDEMAIRAVEAAAPILEESLKSEISSAANRRDSKGQPYSTGELARSISATRVRVNEYGAYSVIKPVGQDSRGVRNAEKMAYLEYGVSRTGQKPHPVREKAIESVRSECENIMEETIYREVDKP